MIGFRFSWVANIDGKSTLVSPFSFEPQQPARELASTCISDRHSSDKDCRCGIYFTTSLKGLASWYDFFQEESFVLEVGATTGWTYEDSFYAANRTPTGSEGIDLFIGNTYRSQGWTRHHMWAPKEHALALRHRYKTPVIPEAPSTETLELVLGPLGITETAEFELCKDIEERKFRKLCWRYKMQRVRDWSTRNEAARALVVAALRLNALTSAVALTRYELDMSEVLDDAGFSESPRSGAQPPSPALAALLQA